MDFNKPKGIVRKMSWEDNPEGKPLELFEKEIKDSAV